MKIGNRTLAEYSYTSRDNYLSALDYCNEDQECFRAGGNGNDANTSRPISGGFSGTSGYSNFKANPQCFVAGTLIKTDGTDTPIEDIEIGDYNGRSLDILICVNYFW